VSLISSFSLYCLFGVHVLPLPDFHLFFGHAVGFDRRKLDESILFTESASCNQFTYFFIIKPTRCTSFPNLIRHETLHVSYSSSAHHQESVHCTLNIGICHTCEDRMGLHFHPGPSRKLSSNLCDIYQCRVYRE
jgi:hypothetical protein